MASGLDPLNIVLKSFASRCGNCITNSRFF